MKLQSLGTDTKTSYSGVFGNLSNTMMELFANIVNGFHALPIFPKKIYHRCLAGVMDICLSYEISKSNKHWINIITDDIVVSISMC